MKAELEEEGMGNSGVGNFSEVGTGEEEEGEGEVVGGDGEGLHAVEEGESERVVVPGCGEGAYHDVEGVIVGVGIHVGEDKRSVGEVFYLYGFGEKVVVVVVNGVHHHLGMNLLHRLRRPTLLHQQHQRFRCLVTLPNVCIFKRCKHPQLPQLQPFSVTLVFIFMGCSENMGM